MDAHPDDTPSDPELDAAFDAEFEPEFDDDGGDSAGDDTADAPDGPLDTANPDVIATARRRYGSAGAALGAAMFAVDQALTGKQKPEMVQIQEASSEPVDLDADGIEVVIDSTTSVQSPALERRPPLGLGKKKPRRR